jgi:ferredoxin-thioredoxin reductase catalytic subunit
MWPMLKGFARDFVRHRSSLKRHDAWIRKHAAKKGWSVNSRPMVYTNLRLWLSDCEEMYGRRYCPCFEPSGDAELDRKLICPCEFAAAEIESKGWCHCTLFGRGDLTPEDYKTAEGCLMAEYRDVPLNWVGGVLDTRGMPIDELRGLPIPDPIHQVKRALNGRGVPLSVIVETKAAVEHAEKLAELRKLNAETVETEGGFQITLT